MHTNSISVRSRRKPITVEKQDRNNGTVIGTQEFTVPSAKERGFRGLRRRIGEPLSLGVDSDNLSPSTVRKDAEEYSLRPAAPSMRTRALVLQASASFLRAALSYFTPRAKRCQRGR